jgi:hypothetical protein
MPINAIKVSINLGFFVQSSKDSVWARRPRGLYDETCCILLRDHFTNTLHGATLRSKAPPIEWYLQLSQLKRIHVLRERLYIRLSAATGEGASAASWYAVAKKDRRTRRVQVL